MHKYDVCYEGQKFKKFDRFLIKILMLSLTIKYKWSINGTKFLLGDLAFRFAYCLL